MNNHSVIRLHPRPTSLTIDMTLRAAEKVVKQLVNRDLIQVSAHQTAIAEIAGYGRAGMDGYDLAKRLDHYAGWTCNTAMVRVLDDFGRLASKEIDVAQWEWQARYDIQPQLTTGARVKMHSGEMGTIAGVDYNQAASYLVSADVDHEDAGETKFYRVVPFEYVDAIDEMVGSVPA